MSELEQMISDGFEKTDIKINEYEVYEHETGRCVLYDPVKDYVMPFIEQVEYDCEDNNENRK